MFAYYFVPVSGRGFPEVEGAVLAILDDAQELAEAAWNANHAKSRFLASMSHEMRTPLNAIVGYAQLLEMEIAGPLTAGQEEYLGRLTSSSGHLIGLIDDILDLSRVE